MTDLALETPKLVAQPSRLRRLFRWLATDLRAALAILVLLVLVIVAIGAPWIAPYPPTAQDVNNMLAAPGPQHLLGTDDLGRDIFSRLVYGAPATVYASLLAVGVAIAIGLPVGLIAGFFGGWTDDIISRVIDTFLSFPAIVLAIAVTGALGIGLTNGMIAVGIVMFPALARIVRARTLIVRQELYVDASRCFGAPAWHILWRHVLPNALQPVIVQVTLLLAAAHWRKPASASSVWVSSRQIRAGERCWPAPISIWRSRPSRCMPRGLPSWSSPWHSMRWESPCALCSIRP